LATTLSSIAPSVVYMNIQQVRKTVKYHCSQRCSNLL